jgi:hypothetical protein
MRRLLMSVGAFAAFVVLFVGGQAARADVIYDNFDVGDNYQTNIGWTIGLQNPKWIQGDPFAVSGTYTLSQITVAGTYVLGPNVFTVYLMDDAGGVPGNIIEEFDFVGLGQFGNYSPPLVAQSVLNPTLEDGAVYWLVATTDDAAWTVWNWNSTGDSGPHAQQQDYGDWTIVNNTHGAFRVEADPAGPSTAKRGAATKPIAATTTEIDPASITIIP